MPPLTPAADAIQTIQRHMQAGSRLAGSVRTVLSVLARTRDAATEQRLAALDAAIEILEAEMADYDRLTAAGRPAVTQDAG